MKTEHTPEPWEQFNGYLIRHVVGDYAAPIAEMRTPYRYGIGIVRGEHEQQANARRIVACVNACSGIGTEYLEHFGATTFNDFKRMKNQRDELLAAMIHIQQVACSGSPELGIATSAIASIKDTP